METNMTTATVTASTPALPVETPSGARLWTGRVITALIVLLLAADSGGKLLEAKPSVKGSIQLGFDPAVTFGLGALLALCTLVYVVPRTAGFGAVLLTGYLGGAVASHLRAGNGTFPIVFSLTVGALVWLGLILREPAVLRALMGRS
jgi:hypothetical protein